LLTAAISFIALTMPYSTFELFRKIGVNRKWLRNRNIMRAFMMLIDINHATNFILYCATGQRFRTELKSILCCENRSKRGGAGAGGKNNASFSPLNYNYRNSIHNKINQNNSNRNNQTNSRLKNNANSNNTGSNDTINPVNSNKRPGTAAY
jgi:hypothetical protein